MESSDTLTHAGSLGTDEEIANGQAPSITDLDSSIIIQELLRRASLPESGVADTTDSDAVHQAIEAAQTLLTQQLLTRWFDDEAQNIVRTCLQLQEAAHILAKNITGEESLTITIKRKQPSEAQGTVEEVAEDPGIEEIVVIAKKPNGSGSAGSGTIVTLAPLTGLTKGGGSGTSSTATSSKGTSSKGTSSSSKTPVDTFCYKDSEGHINTAVRWSDGSVTNTDMGDPDPTRRGAGYPVTTSITDSDYNELSAYSIAQSHGTDYVDDAFPNGPPWHAPGADTGTKAPTAKGSTSQGSQSGRKQPKNPL
jgi:hypothetical protein